MSPRERDTLPLEHDTADGTLGYAEGQDGANIHPAFGPKGLSGSTVDRYEIGPMLGRGGASQVYEAHDKTLKRKVALKILLGDAADWTRQSLQEARAQASVDHEYICKVYDVGKHGDYAFIAMQHLDGLALDKASSKMSLEEKVGIMGRILLAVEAAHHSGLIHRDLKPANIMVEQGEGGFWKPYVTDFGLARELKDQRISASGKLHGTPAYMAPEQARGDSLRDTRADIYSLGATFFELLTGQAPFSGRNPVAVMLKVVNDPPPDMCKLNKEIPQELAAIIARAMEKDPEKRFDSIHEFRSELNAFVNHYPVPSYNGGRLYPLQKWVRRNQRVTVVGGSLILALCVLAGFFIREQWYARQQGLLLNRYLDEARVIELQLRISHMLPVHDVRSERQAMHERLTKMGEAIEQEGEHALGPGHYVMGRAYLELGDVEKARQYLEKARSHGFWTAPVVYAWGEAMVGLYEKKASELLRIDRDNMDLAELREALLVPGLASLRQGEGVAVRPRKYLEAQLAYFDGDYDSAFEKANLAHEKNRWFYEALLLAGKARLRQGANIVNRGSTEEALKLLEEAGHYLEEARNVAHSDISVYEALCEQKAWLLDIALREGKDVLKAVEDSLSLIDLALKVNADSSEIHQWLAYSEFKYGEYLIYFGGENIKETLEAAIAASQRALALDPNAASAYKYLGHSYSVLCQSGLLARDETYDTLLLAQNAYESALKIKPGNVAFMVDLGMIHWQIADSLINRERLSLNHLDKAETLLRQVLIKDNDFSLAHNNLGLVYWTRAEISQRSDLHPEGDFKSAMDSFQRSIDLNGYEYAYANFAETALFYARWLANSGADALPILNKIDETLISWKEKNRNDYLIYQIEAGTARLRAYLSHQRGMDASMHLRHATDVLEETFNNHEQAGLKLEFLRVQLLSLRIGREKRELRGGEARIRDALSMVEKLRGDVFYGQEAEMVRSGFLIERALMRKRENERLSQTSILDEQLVRAPVFRKDYGYLLSATID